MKVLLTGFDPFGGESVNPAFEAIKLLPSTIAGAEIVYVEIPTEFKKSAPAVEAAIKEHNPDIVILRHCRKSRNQPCRCPDSGQCR